MSNVNNVTAGKPKIGGAISVAPKGTTLPNDATTDLGDAFEGMGYCGEDGLVNSNSPQTETVKAWGGDNVLTTLNEKPDTFKFTLLETLNINVLKFVHGSDNASGTLASGITVKANSKDLAENVLVVDMLMRENVVKRVVLPKAQIKSIGDVSYIDTNAVGYEVTVDAFPDALGNTHYEYIKQVSA